MQHYDDNHIIAIEFINLYNIKHTNKHPTIAAFKTTF